MGVVNAVGQTSHVNRIIHTQSVSRQVPAILQAVFAAELVAPSSCLWIVSPWISNIPILDNSANAFRHVEPNWPRGKVRLVSVLVKLLEEGTTVHVATRPTQSGPASKANDAFVEALQKEADWEGCPLRMHRKQEERLHQKGLLGDDFYLRGSMNFTHNGIQHNNEQVEYTWCRDTVARARHEFKERWGGALVL